MVRLIEKADTSVIAEIDKDVKNKFRWAWLEKSVTLSVKIGKKTEEVTELLRDYVGKCDVAGKAQCLYCSELINYGSRGCIALIEHAKGKKHCEKVAIRRTNYSLGSAFKLSVGSEVKETLVVPAFAATSSKSKPLVPLADRKSHSEVSVSLSSFFTGEWGETLHTCTSWS